MSLVLMMRCRDMRAPRRPPRALVGLARRRDGPVPQRSCGSTRNNPRIERMAPNVPVTPSA